MLLNNILERPSKEASEYNVKMLKKFLTGTRKYAKRLLAALKRKSKEFKWEKII